MANKKLSPVMSDAAFEVLAKLDKPTLIDFVFEATRLTMQQPRKPADEHEVLRMIDQLLQPIDLGRKQRPKLLASRYAEQRVAAAQGGAVVTKQVRTRITPRRRQA